MGMDNIRLLPNVPKTRRSIILNKKAAALNPTTMRSQRTCPNGHTYYKTSDCPTCPVCEAAKKPAGGFLSLLSAPARRALASKNIQAEKQLSQCTEKEILALHGIGPAAIPVLKKALQEKGLAFKK